MFSLHVIRKTPGARPFKPTVRSRRARPLWSHACAALAPARCAPPLPRPASKARGALRPLRCPLLAARARRRQRNKGGGRLYLRVRSLSSPPPHPLTHTNRTSPTPPSPTPAPPFMVGASSRGGGGGCQPLFCRRLYRDYWAPRPADTRNVCGMRPLIPWDGPLGGRGALPSALPLTRRLKRACVRSP